MTDKVQFVFKSERVVEWPLKLQVAMDGGTVQEQTVTAKIKQVSQDRITELATAAKEENGKPFGIAFYDECVQGFVDFKDASGIAVPDTTAIAFFRGLTYGRDAVLRAHAEIVSGVPAVLEKN